MSQANKIDHECVSADSLAEYLKQKCGYQNLEVERVPKGQDPPDFWLNIDGNRFAVEETSIAMQNTVTRVGHAGLKWEGEVQDEITGLIQNAVLVKKAKLEKKGVPRQCIGIILLLYDVYGFGDAEDAQTALRKVHGHDWFHSVFWAASFTNRPNGLYPNEPGRMGSFLYTKEARWENQLSR